VLELETPIIIGIDLAGSPKNPTGWALWKDKAIKADLVYTDEEILESVLSHNPSIIAIDAPLRLPKEGILRKADKEMIKRGYRVFPPGLPAMKKLTLRAIKINTLILEKGYKTIEVHPTSTRKALSMPLKDWGKIQTILKTIGISGEIQTRPLASHEIDAATAALTAHLHIKNQTEAIGDEEEGFIIIPKKMDWRTLKV
jgi:predicted nuclease with RNAse H fold